MAKTFKGTDRADDFRSQGTTDDDTFYGYRGNDTFGHSYGNDTFDGGADIDGVTYAGSHGGVQLDLLEGKAQDGEGGRDILVSIENVVGSQFGDELSGDNNNNELRGMGGRDTLYGRGGQDTLYADHLDYRVDGGAGIDTMVISTNVHLTITLNNDGTGTATSDLGTVQLQGIENITVNASGIGHDPAPGATLTGNNLDNTLRGSSSAIDMIDGGDGSDILFGGSYFDLFVFDHVGQGSEHQHDVIRDFQPGIDRIDLLGTEVEDFEDLFTPGDRYMEQVGNDVVIHTSEDNDTSITLQNVQMSSLSEADFRWMGHEWGLM